MHPFFVFKSVMGLDSAGLVITKMLWERLVAVKWSLVGSMYMLLNRAKIQCIFGISKRFMNIYM